MAEFIVSARLTADASGMRSGVEEGKKSLDGLQASTRSAANENQRLATSNGGLIRAFQQMAIAARAQKNALDQAAISARRHSQAMQQVGIQLGDVTQQLALGQHPALVLGQQLGQLTLAASGLGGTLGTVATFLAGPWGAAITGAVTVLGLLASGMLSSESSTNRATRAKTIHEMTTRELIDAINDENAALGRAIQTGREAEVQTIRNAEAQHTELVQRRQNIIALLEQARAQEQLNEQIGREGLGRDTEARVGGAAVVSSLERQISEANAALRIAEQAILRARVPLLERDARAATDPRARINDQYDRAVADLNRAFTSGLLPNQTEYNRLLEEEIRRRDRQLEQVSEREQAERRAGTEARRTAREARQAAIELEREAIARVRAIGGSVNSSFRTPEHNRAVGGVANSFHLSHRALDIAPGPGINASTIRRALQGFDITELINEADHWHVAWSGALEGVGESADQLSEELRQLGGDFNTIVRQFDPATAAAMEYAATLERIQRLAAAGLISPDQAEQYSARATTAHFREQAQREEREAAAEFERVWGHALTSNIDDVRDGFIDAGRAGGRALRDEGLEAAQAIAQLLGGKLGRTLGPILGVFSGLQSGNFNSVGGGLGGALTLLGGVGTRTPQTISLPGGGSIPYPQFPGSGTFADGLAEVFDPISRGLRDLIGEMADLFGGQGAFTRAIGKVGGYAVIGSGVASLVGGSKLGGSIGGALGGVGGEMLGKALGSALGSLGSFAGPVGSIVGSIAGSLLGKALTPSKRGSATITSASGGVSTRGNDAGFIGQSSGLAKNVQGALNQIAEQLGGSLGSFSVSIGVRDGKFRVDPTGRGITKTKKGAIDFGTDEAAAQAAALADAIADGAIQGLSAAMQAAIRSSPDVDKAIREALKVQEVEDIMTGLGADVARAMREFERTAAERVRIAKQYGFDETKIAEYNATERLKLEERLFAATTGSLRDLIKDFELGDLFEGSPIERLAKLRAERDRIQAQAEAGIEGAPDELADILRQIAELSRETFGTAGGEFAADRASAITSAQRVIELENQRLADAKAATQQTNDHLEEANSQLSQQTTILRNVEAYLSQIAAGGGGGNVSIDLSAFTGRALAFE